MKLILLIVVPFSLLGVCGLLGSALAGMTLDFTLVSGAVFLSAWFPLSSVSIVGLAKFIFGKSTFLKEHKGLAIALFSVLAVVLVILLMIVLGILTSLIYDTITKTL